MPESNQQTPLWQRVMQQQFARFLSVGALNTLLGYSIIFFAMYALNFSPEASNLLGYSVGLVVSFLLSKSFTFRSSGAASSELIRFLLVFAIAYAINLAELSFLVRVLAWHAGISQLLAGVFYVLCSYFLKKRFVFLAGKSS